jgi:hypothetical protein
MNNNTIEYYNNCREEFKNVCNLIDKKMNDIRTYDFELDRFTELYRYDKKFKSEIEMYNNLKKKTLQEIEELQKKKKEFSEILKNIDLFGNLKGDYEIKKGLPGMLRDINMKLTYYLDNDEKRRQLFTVSSQYFKWKDHFIFINLHSEPKIKRINNTIRVRQHLFKGNSNANASFYDDYIDLSPEMFPDSGIYQLQVTLVSTFGLVVAFNSGDKKQIWIYDYHINNFFNNNNIFNEHAHWREGDKLLFLIDTHTKEITYIINGQLVECFKFFFQKSEPLIAEIKLGYDKLMYIQYFGKILDDNVHFLNKRKPTE